MSKPLASPALDPLTVPERRGSRYPTEAFRALVAGRAKRALGDTLGLHTFGVNLVRLDPGAHSSLRHWHLRQDEFVWILEGEITLVTDDGEQTLGPGMCAGFAAGTPNGHHLVNRTSAPAVYLEVGDRLPGDGANYPGLDLRVRTTQGGHQYQHADGRPYE
jgi:uncharacterized cupin superfamily protein